MPGLKEYALNGKKVTPDEFVELMKDRQQYFHDNDIHPSELSLYPEAEFTLVHRTLLAKLDDQQIPEGEELTPIDAYYKLQPFAIRQICNRLEIPTHFFIRCRKSKTSKGDRLDAHFDEWISRCDRQKNWFIRFDNYSGEEEIRAVLTSRYDTCSNLEIAEMIADDLPNKNDYQIRFEWTSPALYGQIVSDTKVRTLANGQEIKGGIRFKNSEVGFGSIALEMLVLCEAISTGPILPGYVGIRRAHLRRKTELRVEFKSAVEQLLEDMDKALDTVEATQKIILQDVDEFLETLFLVHKIDNGQIEAVMETAAMSPIKTLYDAVSMFSVAGTDPGLNVERREKLQRVSGELVHSMKKYGRWIAPNKV